MLSQILRFEKPLQAVFFDFDGVLVDSVPIKTAAYSEIFSDHGEEAQKEIASYHQKHGGVDRFRKIEYVFRSKGIPWDPNLIDLMAARFGEIVKEKVIRAPEINGATEAFLSIRRAGIFCAVVSGTPETELQDIVRERGWSRYFDEVHGSPAIKINILEKIIHNHNFNPGRCLFVGDSATDFEAASKNNIYYFHVRS